MFSFLHAYILDNSRVVHKYEKIIHRQISTFSVCCVQMPTAKYLEDAENLSKMFRRVQNAPNSDEMVVTEAKRKGKELYADLEPEARKQKLDSMVSSPLQEGSGRIS